jgi:transcriptional regulator with XRE-family HTH domain
MKINKQKLQLAMANACLNMDDLAALAEISRVSISNYISGLRNPKPKTLGKIAKALNVPVENLIDMEGGV